MQIKNFLKNNTYLYALIYAPIVSQIAVVCVIFVMSKLLYGLEITDLDAIDMISIVIAYSIPLALSALFGFIAAKRRTTDSYFKTYFALFLPLILALFNVNAIYYFDSHFYSILFFLGVPREAIMAWILISSGTFSVFVYLAEEALIYVHYGIAAFYICFAIGFGAGLRVKKPAKIGKKAVYISLAIVVCELLTFGAQFAYKNSYTISQDLTDMQPVYDETDYYENDQAITLDETPTIPQDLTDMRPLVDQGYFQSDRVIAPDKTPTFYFESDLPILDGATTFCPIFYSAAKTLYKKPDDFNENEFKWTYASCGTTPYAYNRLYTPYKDHRADLIFVFEPSNDQLAEAKKAGVEFELTPIGKEAFVFLVNEQNPIKSLTIEQIQKIYTGEITNWREVGGADEEILAFQRDQGSGSQTAMENSVMKGQKLKKALEEESYREMMGLVRSIADYRNAKNAIGYSFRFYVTDMVKAENVRLLAINGVEPSLENIQNGSYPLIHEFYIVGRKNDISENAKKLIDWFLSDQGQNLIKKAGYAPITN
ncbi:MAG: substrate-binding domain-containing protein [Helicobacteraceae bacterium]|jgi:phosphate transport system substrate-binding protein|nr:substrate-binding domain-containing protein [Helicobacteraceae bacterium]